MATYATSSDMTARFDERVLKDLCSDTGTPVGSLSGNTRMTAVLEDATGAINSALMNAKMYAIEDLEALSGENAAILKRMTCEVALSYLLLARPEKYKGLTDQVQKRAEEYLERFRQGQKVFNIDVNKNAGDPEEAGLNANEHITQNWIPDRTRGYYPDRQQRLPTGR